MTAVQNFINKETSKFEKFSDIKKSIEDIELTINDRLNESFNIINTKLENNMEELKKKMSEYEDKIISEFKISANQESARTIDEINDR